MIPKMQVNLLYHGKPCSFDLDSEGKSDHSVTIDGKSYAVLTTNGTQPETAENVLKSISLDSVTSEKDLKGRISYAAGPTNESVTAPAQRAAGRLFGHSPNAHVWSEKEEATLPGKREWLAKTLWNFKVLDEGSNLAEFRKFLDPQSVPVFDRAMEDPKDFALFSSLFKDFTANQIFNTCNAERLGYLPFGYVKTEPYTITNEDLQDLKNYLDDVKFSGVITLSDAESSYTICPSKTEQYKDAAFSMHSISKVFTGTLALLTMPEGAFEEKLQLSPEVVKALSDKPILQNHLSTPTLLQTMSHTGGFGDFLGNYEKAVIESKEPPQITIPEEFLKYAENEVYPLDKNRYSNLGSLLTALAVQYKCDDEPFDNLLDRLILKPAGSALAKPENGVFNKEDPCQGKIAGGPAGGYYITAENLQKVGEWMHAKCKEDPAFFERLEKFGREFYDSDDREIRHNGNSSSGSAMLSSFLDSGITLTILSDQSNLMANKIYHAIRENMIEKSDQNSK